MKRIVFAALLGMMSPAVLSAQGWPAEYGGVMLQGFYWDSYIDTQWSYLEQQVDDIAPYFDLIWVPQSGFSGTGNNMGYTPQYYFDHRSSFGTEGQLRSMIRAYANRGTGIIADVVINHRNNLGEGGSWVDYPSETYQGETYQMLPTDIVRNDDGGKTLTWATQHGLSLSDNADTGEGWDGCRDLDHKSANVNRIVKAYEDYLLHDLGYAGFRYDMVKGYSASFTADYNTSAKPAYSVGEYWDGSSAIKRWIDGTKVNDVPTSAAFDFQFRYRVRDVLKNNQWNQLAANPGDAAGYPLIYQSDYRRWAVTFVENHDTEYRSSSAPQDPLKGDTIAANAYMLAMPGTPCVFYKHWLTHKKELKLLISARHQAGITNTSAYRQLEAKSTYYAVEVDGTQGKLIAVIGNAPSSYACPAGYTMVLSGTRYRYYIEDKALQGWNDTVARINDEEAPVPFTPYDATVYVKADFSPVYFYIWDSNNNKQLNGGWPGKRVDNSASNQTVINGETWLCQTVHIPTADYYFNIIFNQGNGKPQTADITRLNSTRYFTATLSGGKVQYEDVTTQYLGLESVSVDASPAAAACYNLQGQRVSTMAPGSLYLSAGHKFLVR